MIDLRDLDALPTAQSASLDRDGVSWRIPDRGEATRMGWRPLLLALIVAVLTGFFLPNHAMPLSILGAGILAVILYIKERQAFVRWQKGPANVTLDRDGLKFLANSGETFRLPLPRYFWIGIDPQTVRATPSLVLLFDGDTISQPIEIHPARQMEKVRGFATEVWNVPESHHLPEPQGAELPVDLDIDDHKQVIQVAGARPAIAALIETLRKFAPRAEPPQVGMRSAPFPVAYASGSVSLQASASSWIDHENIGGPPEFFADLADRVEAALNEATPAENESFVTSTGHRWKLRVRLLQE